MATNPPAGHSPQETDARTRLGRYVMYWALAALTVLGVTAIVAGVLADDDKQRAYMKDVIAVLLPVIAAWVGTILAFYFSRENYVAAAEHNTQVLGLTLAQRLHTIPTQDVMLAIDKADNVFTLPAPGAPVVLKDLLAATADKTGRNRILVREPSSNMRHVAHRSIIDKYLVSQAFKGGNVATLTLDDLVKD